MNNWKSNGWAPALVGFLALGCGGGGGGSGGQTVRGNWYGCQADIIANGSRYQLPTNCIAINNATNVSPVPPVTGGGPVLQLQGVCACAVSPSDASAICSDANNCDTQVNAFFHQRAAMLNPNVSLPTAELHCVPRNSNSGPITAIVSAVGCNVSGDNVSTIQIGLTASNGDYETPLSGVPVTLNVHKVVDLPSPIPNFTYDATRTFVGEGSIRYSWADDGLGACPVGGCPLRVDSLVLLTPGQSATFDPPVVDSHTVSNIELRGIGTLTGSLQNDGTLKLQGRVIIRFDVDGSPFTATDDVVLTGFIDRVTGGISINGFSDTVGSEGDDSGRKTVTFGQIQGGVSKHPPTARISAPSMVECVTPNNTPLSLSALSSTDPENDIARYEWLLPDGSAPLGPTVAARLTLGANPVSVLVSDSRLGTGARKTNVQVVDTTRPAITSPNLSNYTVCDSGSEPIVLAPPTAVDGCTGVARIFGEAPAANGGPPIVFDAGQPIVLKLGTQVVRWFASDVAGNVAEFDQTINVAPVFTAFGTFEVRDRAQVLVASAATRPAAIGNAGLVTTEIGANSMTGTVRSKATVFLRSHSSVTGNVISAGTIQPQDGVQVSGLSLVNTNPQLPPSMPLFAPRPSQRGGSLILDSGAIRTLNPGAYGSVIVHPNAVVQLSSGVYTFDDLLLDTGAIWRVPAGASVKIVIRNDLTHRGNFVIFGNSTPATQIAILSYGEQVVLGPSIDPNAFYGWRLFAPNAATTVSNNASLAQLMSKTIDVAADRKLVCVPQL